MKRMKLVAIPLCLAISGQAFGMDTYTWALDSGSNSSGFDSLLTENLVVVSPNRPAPSRTELNTNMESAWLGNRQTGNGIDYTALYRTRPALKSYPEGAPPPVTFENWAFVRKFVYFGGEHSSGAHVIAPDPNWVTAAHENGVKIYGTVYIDATHGNSAMVKSLIGFLTGTFPNEELESSYHIPALKNLEKIAKALKLDGWFLNIEQGFDDSTEGRQQVIQMNRLIEHIFPKFKQRGVEFITYTGDNARGIHGAVTDGNIANFGHSPLGDYGLDNATGINPAETLKLLPAGSQKDVLLYLDEVFSRNTPLGRTAPLRIQGAKATQCQYFKGSGVWPGLKEYTKAVYPKTKLRSEVLCAGADTAPAPTTVLKINVMTWPGVESRGWTVTAKNSGVRCDSSCYLEFSQGGLTEEVLEFNHPIEFQQDAQAWLGSRRDMMAWSGWQEGDPRLNLLDPLFVQYMPGFKWWEKEPRLIRGDLRDNNAQGGFVWDYAGYAQEGLRCVPVTAEQAAAHSVAQDRACIIRVPTYGTMASVPNSAVAYGPFGAFPLLNLTMQVNTEGFTYYALYEQLTAK
ncbi:hypothetical protein ABU614_17625 [Lysobacter firmicutimachus]|uniref:Cytosolic endo-beta-N-acetylglucosaminidase TIM barrel domain-containing protein n=1 Tax=Lysobacter firmicutimachus TaxID=1792846 RepID=A0AAU8MRF8_9GAMM